MGFEIVKFYTFFNFWTLNSALFWKKEKRLSEWGRCQKAHCDIMVSISQSSEELRLYNMVQDSTMLNPVLKESCSNESFGWTGSIFFGDVDRVFWKTVKTYLIVPMSCLKSPFAFDDLSSHWWSMRPWSWDIFMQCLILCVRFRCKFVKKEFLRYLVVKEYSLENG
jgi:hypothetical protein